jgi:MFS family permease
MLFIFRTLRGILAGMLLRLIPTYIKELAPKEINSRFSVYPEISVVLGVLTAYTVAMIITNSFHD